MAVAHDRIASGNGQRRPENIRMSGARALIKSLEAEGVEVIFGYPGGSILPVYDALYDSDIRHVLVRHEQAAAHAADGYARSTGRPGVCFATSGPGATNLVTGLATAYMDSVPLVAITGQVSTSMLGRDAFQEADITGISLPITKHNYLVKDVADLPRVIKEAFYLATASRPGPVLIDLPKDVQLAQLEYYYPEKISLPTYRPTYTGHPRQIKEAARVLQQAERPVLYVGGGVNAAGAAEEVRRLAEKRGIPVTTTLMGLGSFPTSHPLSLGMPGMHGTVAANYALQNCDVLLAVGVRFDDRVTGRLETFAPEATVIHIDVDPAEIGKNVPAQVPIVGDAKRVLTELLPLIEEGQPEQWLQQIAAWKEEYPLRYRRRQDAIMPQLVVEKLYELTGGEAIVATEVGQHQMWVAQFFGFEKPRRLLSSGGLGTMGYGFPAALGAQAANPDCPVIDVAGDGSFQMNIQELATAVAEDLPVKVIVLNNGCLGMVRQWQQLFLQERYAETVFAHSPDFVKIAEGYGAAGIRVEEVSELKPALKKALAIDGPVVVDVKVAGEENVAPMVPVGNAIDEMIGTGGELL